nr:HopJ type III effector protein [uncultured Mucilaginibacter sp.]
MKEQLQTLLASLKTNTTPFAKVIELIDTHYTHQPTAFKNGDAYNEATQNQGSARVFAFAKMNNLSAEDTLYLFAEHYQSVRATPEATDHQNIRQFMAHGWDGIVFEGEALVAK